MKPLPVRYLRNCALCFHSFSDLSADQPQYLARRRYPVVCLPHRHTDNDDRWFGRIQRFINVPEVGGRVACRGPLAGNDRRDAQRLAASVRLLERCFESETSMYPAQPLSRTQQRVAANAIYLDQVRELAPSTVAATVRRPPRC